MKSQKDYNIENFDQSDIKNGCHLACSSFNWINITLFLILVVLLYQYLQK